jgi:hypothetical protein
MQALRLRALACGTRAGSSIFLASPRQSVYRPAIPCDGTWTPGFPGQDAVFNTDHPKTGGANRMASDNQEKETDLYVR